MRKPKSTAQQKATNKRGYKRTLRLKASRKKVAEKRAKAIQLRNEEKKKFQDFIKKLQEAKMNGSF